MRTAEEIEKEMDKLDVDYDNQMNALEKEYEEAKDAEKEKRNSEKEIRYNELKEAYKNYKTVESNYLKDYGSYDIKLTSDEIYDTLKDIFKEWN